jgi:anaerobic magnesium-protoporphyrin IX monomethyl ester cyclase
MPRVVESINDGYPIPLGILYISAAMKRAGFNTFTLNLNHREGTIIDLLRAEMEAHEIDVVMTGGLSGQFWLVESVLKAAKQIASNMITIVGGGLVTADPKATMEALEYADVGVIGEGEETIVELCRAWEEGKSVWNIPGLIMPDAVGWHITSPRSVIADLDSLAWPDYAGFIDASYFKTSVTYAGIDKTNVLNAVTSRSCPYLCTFCFHTTGRKYRQRSLDSFFAEFDHMMATYPIKFVHLSDDLFGSDLDRVRDFCKRIKPYGISWSAQFRVDTVTAEMVDILKDSNCASMSFGIESADNHILKSMRKNITIEQIDNTLCMVTDKGMPMVGALIFGDQEETRESAQRTIDWWKQHPEYNVALSMILTFPGTQLYKWACARGIITDRVEYLKRGYMQINVSKMTDAEYQDVIHTIRELQGGNGYKIELAQMVNLNATGGRVDILGFCARCKWYNEWEGIKLFRPFNYVSCKYCGAKHAVEIPDQQKEDIRNNILRLENKYGRVAIYGMNGFAVDLINKIYTLLNVYPVDNSESVRNSNLIGRTIYPPDILEEMPVIVVALSMQFSNISALISSEYAPTARIIDICHLLDPEYKI